MAEKRPTLPPGVLPNVFDTDPHEMHPATVIHEGYVGVDTSKCTKAELAEVKARIAPPNLYEPEHKEPETKAHERNRSTGHVGPDRA